MKASCVKSFAAALCDWRISNKQVFFGKMAFVCRFQRLRVINTGYVRTTRPGVTLLTDMHNSRELFFTCPRSFAARVN